MAAKCKICKERPRSQAESSIQCTKCLEWLHMSCVGKGKVPKLNPLTFKCDTCDHENSEVRLPEFQKAFDIEEQLMKITEKLVKLDQLDIIQETLSKSMDKMIALETRVQDLEQRIVGKGGIQDGVQELGRDIEEMKQYTRVNSLIISGIPDKEALEPKQVAIDIANYLGINISLANIDTAHRLPTRAKGKDRPIVVKFVNRWCKDDIMEKLVEINLKRDYLDTQKLGYIAAHKQCLLTNTSPPRCKKSTILAES